MNELIIKMFPLTEDAVLINKYFGCELDGSKRGIMFGVLFADHAAELLAEAKRLQTEDDEKAKK